MGSNDLALRQGGALAITDDEMLASLKASVYPGAADQSVRMVLAWCRAAGKDPLKRPVHIVPMSVKKPGTRDQYEWRDVLMPGIVDYRTDASRTGQHAGNDEAVFGPDVRGEFAGGKVLVTYPEWCEFKVYRMVDGQRCAFSSGRVRWRECYATASKDSDAPNAMWRKRPFGQLEKCAEAMALRRGFPEVGAAPTAEEMAGRVVHDDDVIDGAALVQPPAPPPVAWPDEVFATWLAGPAQRAINAGRSADDVIAFGRTKGPLSVAQEAMVRALRGVAPDADFVRDMDDAAQQQEG